MGGFVASPMSNAMNQGQRRVPARKRVISHCTILKELARHLMHALKCLQDGNAVSPRDGRASSAVTGRKRDRVAELALPELPAAYRLVKPISIQFSALVV